MLVRQQIPVLHQDNIIATWLDEIQCLLDGQFQMMIQHSVEPNPCPICYFSRPQERRALGYLTDLQYFEPICP